ncbi:High mobility group B protein 10 [Hirschfeldia incana]|nr:High mobility group B protein 10 [Hirschfeldia incana]
MSTVSPSSSQLVQVVPDNQNNNTGDQKVKYEDLVRDSDIFLEHLRALLGLHGNTLKVPTVGGSTLDLHRLFVEVTSRGGIAKVIKDRRWREVIGAFNFPNTITSASFVLRRYYFKFLFQIEHVYYLKQSASSMKSAEEAMHSLTVNLEEGTDEPQIGGVVKGVIDGKFESGYLVTMKYGSKVLKGVLYHAANRQSQQPQQTMGTPPSGMAPSSSQRRAKKKARVAAEVDSQKPKCHRSGYNFFFAEQYARLKPEYQGKERIITKMIGRMWGDLSESEKQVYQDKGVKDVERYRTEMMEYKSAHEAGASASAAAATVAQ